MSDRRKANRRVTDFWPWVIAALVLVQSTVMAFNMTLNLYVLWNFQSFVEGLRDVMQAGPAPF